MSPDTVGRLAEVATSLLGEPGETQTVRTAVARSVGLVDGATEASMTLHVPRSGMRTVAASTDRAQRADDLQYALGEGPCVEAAGKRGWVRSGAVGHDPRWPRWGPRAAGIGFASLLSVSLTAGEETVGALNLYGEETGGFADPDVLDLAMILGAHVAAAVTTARTIAVLEDAIGARHWIGMAQGILMEQHDVSAEEAFALLKHRANDTNATVRAVAGHVVRHRALPAED